MLIGGKIKKDGNKIIKKDDGGTGEDEFKVLVPKRNSSRSINPTMHKMTMGMAKYASADNTPMIRSPDLSPKKIRPQEKKFMVNNAFGIRF
jgi:hypothetical protein